MLATLDSIWTSDVLNGSVFFQTSFFGARFPFKGYLGLAVTDFDYQHPPLLQRIFSELTTFSGGYLVEGWVASSYICNRLTGTDFP